MQARTKAARTKSDPPVDVLMARCSRESLEQLVIKAVASEALSVNELLHTSFQSCTVSGTSAALKSRVD